MAEAEFLGILTLVMLNSRSSPLSTFMSEIGGRSIRSCISALSQFCGWTIFIVRYLWPCTVVVQRKAEGVGMRAQGKLRAHGNYKVGRARE